MSTSAANALGPVAIPSLIFLASLALNLTLWQEAPYGDAPSAIMEIETGAVFSHAHHYLYQPLVAGVRALLSPWGWSLFDVGRLLSSIGGATGSLFVYLTARVLGEPRSTSILSSLYVTSCPAVLFFSSTMEFHGPFFGLASVATMILCIASKNQSLPWFLAAGVAAAVAYLAHATAHLFVGSLCLVAILHTSHVAPAKPRSSWRKRILNCASFAGIYGILSTALTEFAGTLPGSPAGHGRAAEFASRFATANFENLGLAPKTLWFEFIWPYIPLAILLPFAALKKIRYRRLTTALALSAPPYVALCILLVPGYNEHGAYQLPLVWMAAIPIAQALSKRASLVITILSASLGITQISIHDAPERAKGFAMGVEELANRQSITLIIGGDFVASQAYAAYLASSPNTEVFDIGKIVARPLKEVLDFLPLFDLHTRARIARGEAVILAQSAYDMLSLPSVRQLGTPDPVKLHLDRHYTLTPIAKHGFQGFVLR